jgi:hypothetical protein
VQKVWIFMETLGQVCLVRNRIQTKKLLGVNHYTFGCNYQFCSFKHNMNMNYLMYGFSFLEYAAKNTEGFPTFWPTLQLSPSGSAFMGGSRSSAEILECMVSARWSHDGINRRTGCYPIAGDYMAEETGD